MSFEEQFDKIVKQKAENAEFPFDNSNWEKAAAMLDAERVASPIAAKRSRWIPAVIGLGVVLVAGYFVIPDQTSEASVKLSSKKDQTAKNYSSENQLQSASGNSKHAAATTPDEQLNRTGVIKAQEVAVVNPQPLSPPNNSPLADPEVLQPALSKNAVSKTNNSIRRTNRTNASGNQAQKQTGVPEQFVASEANNESSTANSAPESNNEKRNNVLFPGSPVSETAISESNEYIPVSPIVWLSSKTLLLDQQVNEPEVFSSMSYLSRYDNKDYVRTPFSKYLAIVGGIHYGLGWQNGAAVDGKGVNYFGGIEFGKHFGKMYCINAGLQYFSFGNIASPYYESIGKGYGFGYTQSYISVRTQQLNYLSLPVMLQLQSKDGFFVGAGFTANYLVSAKNTISSYGISDGVRGSVTNVENKDIYDGTKSFGAMAGFRAGVVIKNRATVFGELQYGLNDLFDSQTKKQNNERITGLRVGLSYYLINR